MVVKSSELSVTSLCAVYDYFVLEKV